MRELAEQWTKGAGREETLRRAGATPGGLEPGEVWSKPIAGNVIPPPGRLGERGIHVRGEEAGPREPQDPPRAPTSR